MRWNKEIGRGMSQSAQVARKVISDMCGARKVEKRSPVHSVRGKEKENLEDERTGYKGQVSYKKGNCCKGGRE